MSGSTPTVDEVRQEIARCASGDRSPAIVETFVKKLAGASNAALVACSDGVQRAIKGSQLRKHVVAEHVVARLGQLLGAPVGVVGFASIPDELRVAEPGLSHFGAGPAHSTRWVGDCGDRLALEYGMESYNRGRFASTIVLYSLVHADDPQVIYRNQEPRLVYSVDHGHFLAGGAGAWSADSLLNAAPASLHPWAAQLALSEDELRPVAAMLTAVTDDDVKGICLGPPDEWGILAEERDALSTYFLSRRTQLLAMLPA